jgi:beta-glucosidase
VAQEVKAKYAYPFQDPDLPVDERVADLVGRLTLDEKAEQMLHGAPAIPRLGIPAYNWWNECLHGVARAGTATVFPQAIGLAATWDVPLLGRVAEVIADEARAKHHAYDAAGDHDMYKGLTFWAPNINIFRDPRWGRGHETYGECPYLTARLAVAFCRALQGDDPRYLKLVATPKHYAVHSGPEGLRHSFDAQVSPKDLRETYLPAFHACITEAKAESIMAAYNRTNGEPCSGSPTLLQKILRDEWGFGGYVVSDCWAIRDFHEHHKVTLTPEESAARAVTAGCDLNCGCTYERLAASVRAGLCSEADVDACVTRLYRARIRLGMFDPPARVPFASIPYDVVDSAPHRALSRDAARASLVLLKNQGGLLPLRKDLATIAVIGPNAYDHTVLSANYAGTPSHAVTPLDGIRAAVSPRTRVLYAEGCRRTGTKAEGLARDGDLSEAAITAARADAVVLCLGLSAQIEGEQGDAGNSDAAGDKIGLGLTGLQQRLLETVVAAGKPTVLVVIAGSAMDLGWADQHVGAIVQAWYPGQEGGSALGDVLFGDAAPGGRLPVTFPRGLDDLPAFTDYAMAGEKGRTYRYMRAEPLYPFGFGLSYTRFAYREAAASRSRVGPGESCEVSVTVENTGARAADEVVQLYVSDLEASVRVPRHELRGFQRVTLGPGESRRVAFTLADRDLSLIDDQGRRVLEPGRFRVTVGGSQPDARSVALAGQAPLALELELAGDRKYIPY